MADELTERESNQRQYDWTQTPPSVAVVLTIAGMEKNEQNDIADVLETTLQDYIDPAALNTLTTSTATVRLEFIISNYFVQIIDDTVMVSTLDHVPDTR